MGNEFIVSDDYRGYIFVGHAQGNFITKEGEKLPYATMYVLTPVSTFESEDYQAKGWKADRKPCVSPEVWKDLDFGCRVKLFFDDKKKVIMAALDE